MGDQERLARGVGGGIRELRLQDGAGAGEVRRDEPLPLGGEERRTELARPALAHLEQRLGDGPAQRACLEADLLDHPWPRLAGPVESLIALAPPRRDRHGGAEDAGHEGGERAPEQGEGQAAAHEREQSHRHPELRDAHLAEARLRQPVRESVAGPASPPGPGRAGGDAGPAEGDRRVEEVDAVGAGDREEHGDHVVASSACDFRWPASTRRAGSAGTNGTGGTGGTGGTVSRPLRP